ncbi:D-glycerate dehydrogenase [Actinospica sp. MGRD01-02]|uniref:D-glycerate dehydrogenase n=1 Tax=Actinospica acidithermotolerans TaxID=2828514 RepID=A0A941E791_9ACTN|nr:D-glycerate dehydrogenase [Actinospica acidithermotolerans]MBR7825097.1 D-glycerate dehydrogenase [Actinospica acidithermotolerans]
MTPVSRRPAVLVTQPIHRSASAKMVSAGLEVTDLASPVPLTSDEIVQRLGEAQALVCQLTDRVDEHVLSQPGLRVVATVSAGMDHIDLEAARVHGVHVVNTPDVLTEATADLTFALLMAVARRITESDALIRSGGFHGWKLLDELMGADIAGATLGIVGMGRIGQAVGRRAAAFGMSVLYHSRRPRTDLPAQLEARHAPLSELLKSSDFVSLHAPLTEDTHHIIDARALAMMQPHAYLINTSRGPLIDEAALAEALVAGRIAGAALDVFEHEPRVHPVLLERTERVVLTAHAGSATARTRERMSHLAVDGLLRALAAQPAA